MPDGKQNKCKECSKKNNKNFHKKNPNYYWGKDGYFTKRYEETLKYVSDRNKANKTCKIFVLYINDQIYIGSSKTHLKRIKSNLKIQYTLARANPLEIQSSLGRALKDYSPKNAHNLIDNLLIIKEFEGSRDDMKKELIQTIKEYKSQGKNIINKFYQNVL